MGRSRDPSRSSGNYGMQDQRAVLQWVKRAISHFGGDAQKITMMGESVENTQYAASMLTAAGGKMCKWAEETEWLHFDGLAARGAILAVVNNSVALEACA